MKNVSITILLLSLFISLNAQKDTAYIYTFGGENDEQGRDIELTLDSGFIMVGSTSSFGAGNSDIYMVKVDSNINYQWSAAIGHEFTEFGHAVKQTADSGYIVCGYTNSIGAGNYDAYLVRTDKNGKLLWEKTFGGFDWDFAYDLEITADGGFLLVGETHSLGAGNADAYLIKTDKDGNLLWEKTLGGTGKDIAHGLISTNDGNFAFCGENASKNPANKGDAWLVKFDGNGDTLFDKTYGNNESDVALNLQTSKQGRYFLTGKTFEKSDTHSDNLIYSINSNGSIYWSKIYGGYEANISADDFSTDFIDYNSDTIIVVARTKSFGSGSGKYFNIIFLQLDRSTGNFVYGSTFGNPQKGEYCSNCIYNNNKKLLSCVGVSEGFENNYSNLSLLQTDTLSDYVEVNEHRMDSLQKTISSMANKYERGNIDISIIDDFAVLTGLNEASSYSVTFLETTGKLIYSEQISNKEKHQLLLRNSNIHGLFIVRIVSNENEFYFKKLILKNY
mgnify:CR=1 FL=1